MTMSVSVEVGRREVACELSQRTRKWPDPSLWAMRVATRIPTTACMRLADVLGQYYEPPQTT